MMILVQIFTCIVILHQIPATIKAAQTLIIFKGKQDLVFCLDSPDPTLYRWDPLVKLFPVRCNGTTFCPDNGSKCTEKLPVGSRCEIVS
jgi:hypothetical protein